MVRQPSLEELKRTRRPRSRSAGVSPAFTPTYRKGEFFRADVKFTNTTAPAYLALTNIGVLKDGANPDIVTTNTGSLLLPKATETFTYDLDGNLLTDSLWTNAWNAENRLVTVASAPGVPTNAWQRATWSYLADGRWSERVVSTWNGAAYIPQYTNRFVWDGKVLLAILSPANTVAMSFLRGLDLSGSRQGAGGAGGALAITLVTNGTHFYGYDGNGNITTLTAASDGSASAVYEYDPFAKTLRASGVVAQANPLRFSTQFTDEVTGDVVYLFRALRLSLGRWLNRDPIGERGGLNLSGFVRNNPISEWDYLGMAVYGWPFGGEAENNSSSTITIQGDWTTGGVDYTGTHDLPPGATMASERSRGAASIVDSDFLISATAIVYNSAKCIVVAKLPIKIGFGTLVVHDCKCRIGGKGVFYTGGTEALTPPKGRGSAVE